MLNWNVIKHLLISVLRFFFTKQLCCLPFPAHGQQTVLCKILFPMTVLHLFFLSLSGGNGLGIEDNGRRCAMEETHAKSWNRKLYKAGNDMYIKRFNDFISFSKVKEDNRNYDINSFLDTVKDRMGRLPATDLLDFVSEYGFASFNTDMIVTPMEKQEHSDYFVVGPFLGFGNTAVSIEKSIGMFYSEEQIGMKFFPICEGASGDLIIYSLEEQSFGKVYYWSHDSAIGDDTFLIAESFNDFIGRIEARKEEKDDREVVGVKYSPRLLKLINEKRMKDGLPPLAQ